MAEWLRTGLQIRLRRFDSGTGLQYRAWRPSDQASDQGALFLTHPALAALYPPAKRINLPARYTLCGGPALLEGLEYLAKVLKAE